MKYLTLLIYLFCGMSYAQVMTKDYVLSAYIAFMNEEHSDIYEKKDGLLKHFADSSEIGDSISNQLILSVDSSRIKIDFTVIKDFYMTYPENDEPKKNLAYEYRLKLNCPQNIKGCGDSSWIKTIGELNIPVIKNSYPITIKGIGKATLVVNVIPTSIQ